NWGTPFRFPQTPSSRCARLPPREFLQPRIHLAREHLHALHGLVVVEESRLAHDEQMAEAADVVVHLLDLAIDRVGVPREDETALHVLVERRRILEEPENASAAAALHRGHR